MPLIETKGAASAQGFGGAGAGASGPVTYIEDVFSTYLYTGNGSTQTITNGIDLSGKGGLVWIKGRSGTTAHALYDTTRGATKDLVSNSGAAETTQSTGLTAFNGTGFSIGALAKLNTNAATYASWTFRKQPKFFDIVTYTGNNGSRAISHNLGSTPGCMIIKRTNLANDWAVYHRSTSATPWNDVGFLNLIDAWYIGSGAGFFGAAPTSTTFTVDQSLNNGGDTYVAYLFAHNAGGFGLTGTDNVISCGSFTTNASAFAAVSLGYEPQWLMYKRTDAASNWTMLDSMRGIATGGIDATLWADLTSADNLGADRIDLTATGFQTGANFGAVSATYIYIAIRRGPMKTPTSGTSVFTPVSATPSGATTVTTNFPVDLAINAQRDSSVSGNKVFWDRLRGSSTAAGQGLFSNLTNAEVSYSGNGIGLQSNTAIVDNYWNTLNGATTPVIYWNFRRAPGTFDEVCWTPDGTTDQQVAHNLTVVPELIISKLRSGGTQAWLVYSAALGTGNLLTLNTTDAALAVTRWGTPTSTYFILNNQASNPRVAYLWATNPGVTKVGSYTGTGALQTINCGFTSGARFVLIKRTDSTGDWYVYDSARGITSGNDPYLFLNSTAAEVTGTNYVDTDTTGFKVTAAAPAGLNASGGTYIFLAIA